MGKGAATIEDDGSMLRGVGPSSVEGSKTAPPSIEGSEATADRGGG
jgi:hypothetical protein